MWSQSLIVAALRPASKLFKMFMVLLGGNNACLLPHYTQLCKKLKKFYEFFTRGKQPMFAAT